MPIDYSLYPGYWKQFSEYIRFERAGNKCEQCKVPNGEFISRGHIAAGIPFWHDDKDGSVYNALNGELLGRARDYELEIERESKIVLTVAHLDHDGGICDCKARTGRKCARADHCLALCQACHLRLDLPKHIAVRQKTLAIQKDAARPLLRQLFEEGANQ
jgi:hypothetical protein